MDLLQFSHGSDQTLSPTFYILDFFVSFQQTNLLAYVVKTSCQVSFAIHRLSEFFDRLLSFPDCIIEQTFHKEVVKAELDNYTNEPTHPTPSLSWNVHRDVVSCGHWSDCD